MDNTALKIQYLAELRQFIESDYLTASFKGHLLERASKVCDSIERDLGFGQRFDVAHE